MPHSVLQFICSFGTFRPRPTTIFPTTWFGKGGVFDGFVVDSVGGAEVVDCVWGAEVVDSVWSAEVVDWVVADWVVVVVADCLLCLFEIRRTEFL